MMFCAVAPSVRKTLNLLLTAPPLVRSSALHGARERETRMRPNAKRDAGTRAVTARVRARCSA
jgi:hypothetical protein